MKVASIILRGIFDSRGEPTVEVEVCNSKGRRSRASVPCGKSRGKNEAEVFGISQAARSIRKIEKRIAGESYESVRAIDGALLRLDGTPRKSRLGGNVTLAVSIAIARGIAAEKNQPLWRSLADEFFPRAPRGARGTESPLIFSNLINGGAHARDNLSFQEYMVVVKPRASLVGAVGKLINFYREIGARLGERCGGAVPIGDEEGYAVDFPNSAEPISFLDRAIRAARLERDFSIAIDAAATVLRNGGRYCFDGKIISAAQLIKVYKNCFRRAKNLFSIEDPFAEDDADAFRALHAELPKGALIVGDDLTVTNPALIDHYAHSGAVNAAIIKPNQIGTVSESCDAIAAARRHGAMEIVSHRSGETEDSFIIHLARACGAYGVKIGAPARERIQKFNELLRVYSG